MDNACVGQDTDMDPLVENEAKLHITNGIEKASGAAGVDIKVSQLKKLKPRHALNTLLYPLSLIGSMQNRERTDGQTVRIAIPLRHG